MISVLDPRKHLLARVMDVSYASLALLKIQRLLIGRRFIRVINYHHTPAKNADYLRAQLEFFSAHFSPATSQDMDRLMEGKGWELEKPGLIVTFDDGYRGNYLVAAPLLEQYGFKGWFFVPTDWADKGRAQADQYLPREIKNDLTEDDYRIMSWDEIRDLEGRDHVIGCHTKSHHRMTADTSPQQMKEEIVGAKAEMERQLGREVEAFCWVGGEEHAYNSEAAAMIREAGFKYSFMTMSAPVRAGTDQRQIHRSHVDATWPMEAIKFQLSGVVDLLYLPRRKRVNRLTALPDKDQ